MSKPTSSMPNYKNGKTTTTYQSKVVTKSYTTKSGNPTNGVSKPTYQKNGSSNYQYQQKPTNRNGRTADSNKYGNKGTNATKNYQINKPYQQNYSGKHIGDNQTRVETIQDGDYILKITTTRRVIQK